MLSPEDEEFFESCLFEDEIYRIQLGANRPSSIRDQLEKASRFVRLALSDGRFETRNSLLIIGAGVAGVMAAWEAAELGVNVTLSDKASQPYSTQQDCSTRWLHPNEYRWPEQEFGVPDFPIAGTTGVPFILRWEADLPSEIVRIWRDKFGEWIGGEVEPFKGSVTWKGEIELPGNDAELISYFESIGLNDVFDAVLLCIGGREECSVENSQHRGFRFWEKDDYGSPDFGSPGESSAGSRTMISGGGDGALQDFLRIACQKQSLGRPAHALWILEQFLPALESCESFHELREALHACNNPGRPDPGELSQLLARFFAELDVDPGKPLVEAAVDRTIDPGLLDGTKTLQINFDSPAESEFPPRFKPAYTLNAFLVSLVAWRIQAVGGGPVFYPRSRVTGVRSATTSHTCAFNPGLTGCLLKPHVVTFSKHDENTGAALEREYDVVVVRHGIKSPFGESPTPRAVSV